MRKRYVSTLTVILGRSGYDIASLRASILVEFVQNDLPVYAEGDKFFWCPNLKQNGRRNKKGSAFVSFCAPREVRRPKVYLFVYSSFLQRKDLAFP